MILDYSVCHRAFVWISDHMTHTTVAVYVFVEKLINDYVKFYLPQLQKIVMDHVPNTKITTLQIWFFMYKILVLQQSRTSLQLPTIEPRFAKAEHIKGTRNPHQFVHEGSSMRMICISRSTSNVDNHIVDTNRMDLSDITPGSYHACKYDELYFCIVNYISMEHTCMTLMWNSCTSRHLLTSFFGLIEVSAGFPSIIRFAESNLPPLVAQLDTIHLMKLTLIKFAHLITILFHPGFIQF